MIDNLDNKIREIFPEESIYNTPTRYNLFAGVNVPSFIKVWLIKRYSDENEKIDKEALFSFLDKHIPAKNNQGRQIKRSCSFLCESIPR